MSNQAGWRPSLIDVEREFTTFIREFRGGRLVRDLVPDAPRMELNADFIFPEEKIIAELKIMESDPSDANLYSERLVSAFRHFGYSGSDLFEFIFRGKEIPEEVKWRMKQQAVKPIRNAVRKANKQIAATKRHLGMKDAFGLLIFANDANFSVSPSLALSILGDAALRLTECHIDGLVYFTPNLYHSNGTDIAQTIWAPLYAKGKELKSDFVNDMGRAWLDYDERLRGKPLERWAGDDQGAILALSSPIREFKN